MKKRLLMTTALGMLVAAMLLGPGLATASTELFDNTVSACTTANCSSLVLPATLLSFGTVSAGNWVANVFATPGQCVRLDVVTQGTDLEMVVVAPNGIVFRNDDRAVGDLRPLVKIGSAPNNGWYTVHLSHFLGSSVSANFTLLYGRYTAGNLNCSVPTPPLGPAALAPEDLKPDSGVSIPRPGAPGSE